MRGCMTGDFIWIRRSLYSKFFITENKKIDAVDYIGSSEGCISHLVSLNLNGDNFYEDIEDLHSYEKNRNTRSFEWMLKKRTTVSRYSLVSFFFLSLEHIKVYLEEQKSKIKSNIFKAALSSYFPNNFNYSTKKKKKQKKNKICISYSTVHVF